MAQDHSGIVQVETYHADNLTSQVVRSLIRLLCKVADLEVEFIPWGKGGDMITRSFTCVNCKSQFVESVSIFNEEWAGCPNCKAVHHIVNDGDKAWIAEALV